MFFEILGTSIRRRDHVCVCDCCDERERERERGEIMVIRTSLCVLCVSVDLE